MRHSQRAPYQRVALVHAALAAGTLPPVDCGVLVACSKRVVAALRRASSATMIVVPVPVMVVRAEYRQP
ncbi:MAG TPA: hypothetical protein VM487_11900 [Phycisphaerae bacterium]|nr:hypothetical protein [Phycisphaerae bacterium]